MSASSCACRRDRSASAASSASHRGTRGGPDAPTEPGVAQGVELARRARERLGLQLLVVVRLPLDLIDARADGQQALRAAGTGGELLPELVAGRLRLDEALLAVGEVSPFV
jgi:hypothetical protein